MNKQSVNKKVITRIENKLNQKITSVKEVEAGMNNRLYKIATDKNKYYLLKGYIKDDRDRLQREASAIGFLRGHGFNNIPSIFWKSKKDMMALYSFEKGVTVNLSDITEDIILKMSNFLAGIHNIPSREIKVDFPPAVLACFSLNDYVKNVEFRLSRFLEHLDNPHPIISEEFNRNETAKLFEDLKEKALKSLSETQIKKKVTAKQKKLCPIDFGPHNMLVAKDGRESFIDFEYFGYDDPARIIADFQMHDRSFDIDQKLKDLFRSDYLNKVNATKEFEKHLSYVEAITAVEWLTIYLWSITPEKIANRKFSDKKFNEDKYITGQIIKYKERLKTVLN